MGRRFTSPTRLSPLFAPIPNIYNKDLEPHQCLVIRHSGWPFPTPTESQLYFRETRIFDEFTAADFNTKPGYTFDSRINGDMPRSFGFMIDGTLLFRSIKNGFR